MDARNPSIWVGSERLAAHALSVRAEDLPGAVKAAVRAFTLDTIGVGIGGVRSPYAPSLLNAVRGWGSGDAASVWGLDARLPAPHTAFMNAFLAHCQEFDCVHEAAVLHPFTVVVPVLLAEAEACGVDGATYLAACAAGVDVAVTLGVAATSQIQFFRPATCGLFGAVAALCRARGVSKEQAVNAFGYALAFASGTMQAHVEGTPALAVQVGNGARSAFWAVDIAQAGLPGPKGAVDGPFGYLSLFEKSSALAPALDALGSCWRAAEVSWKPYPTGRAAHGGIDMALQLRAKGVIMENVQRIVVQAPPLILHLVGRPIVRPLEVNYARLCLPYAMAVSLRRGAVTLADFTPEALNDEETLALAARIEVAPLDIADPAAFVPQRATAYLRDGARFEVEVTALPGSPARPLAREEQVAKLSANFAFGLGEDLRDGVQELVQLCDELEALPDVSVLNRTVAWAERS
jgi:2-methylcitrate dehydratase PrpD